MKCALRNCCRVNGSRSPKVRSNCEIHSAKTRSRCGQAFWPVYLPFSIETFERARNASPFSKLAAHSFRQKEKKNGISAFCSGEVSRARRIGGRKQIAVSISSIFEARSTLLFQISPSVRETFLTSHCRPTFTRAIGGLVT